MIGGDPGPGVGRKLRPAQARGMAVHLLAHLHGGLDLGHHLRGPADDPGEIHHLGQKKDVVPPQQFCHLPGRNPGPGGFKDGGRHTGGGSEEELQRCSATAGDHKINAGNP